MNLTVDSTTTVASVLEAHPGAARVFARHAIDFCCGGGRPLAEAAGRACVSVAALLAEIEAAERRPDDVDWGARPVRELVEHIVARHHRPLDEELPRLAGLAAKVARVHGGPVNDGVERLYAALVDDLVPHMLKEESVLFPLTVAGDPRAVMPIRVMHLEHDTVGAILRELRVTTRDYQLPEAACGSWRALWQGLEALEADLHRHIHLENNVLFPRILGR